MTQLPKRFIVDVYDRLGQTKIITYTSESPGGIVGGFVSRRYANNCCGPMDFEAKPSETRIEAGSILATRFDTGTSVVPVHFGVVTSNPDGRSGKRGTYQVASGKELLKRSVCADNIYSPSARAPVDAAYFVREAVRLYRHSALKYDQERIAGLGYPLTEVPSAGRNLHEVIAAILEAVPDIGENDWGVDLEGYFVLRPPTGEINRLKSSVITQFGDITSDNVVTKATILVANTLSAGALPNAAYRPSVVSHSYTHPENSSWQERRQTQEQRERRIPAVLKPRRSGHHG
jgi:hypothetical protein